MTLTLPTPENTYEPRGGAVEILNTKAREVLAEGPTRTGKTRSLLEKAYAAASKYPKARILLVRKTRASLSETILQTLEDHVFPKGVNWVGTCTRSHRDHYTLPNKSMIVPAGMDTTDKIMGSEWDRIFCFEWTEAKEDDHERLLTRMSNEATPFRQIICDCNPAHPMHWLNKRASRGMHRIMSRHKDNPRFWTGTEWTPLGREYMQTLEALTGARRERYLHGRWALAEGMVYTEYDTAVHVIDRMPDGWQSWRKYRSIDFGFNDPFVCQWWADSGEAMYLYREWYMSGRIVSDHAKEIVRLSAGEDYEATVADHDREDRETLHRGGVYTIPATKDIDRGIDAVKDRLKVGPNGKPRLYVLASALVERDRRLDETKRPTSLADEWDAYIYKQDRAGSAKDEPVDRDNHGMDAMRYAVMAVDNGTCIEPYFSMGG